MMEITGQGPRLHCTKSSLAADAHDCIDLYSFPGHGVAVGLLFNVMVVDRTAIQEPAGFNSAFYPRVRRFENAVLPKNPQVWDVLVIKKPGPIMSPGF